jgi:riboflavin biosynthesis pyrimidine reductase
MGTRRAHSASFADYCRQKEQAAVNARLCAYSTLIEDAEGVDLLKIGSNWSRALFDGDFYRSAGARSPDLPAVTLVYDWPPDDPREEGGPGPLGDETTLHLIHEGLARVDADGVMGGLGVVREPDFVASVWHPELVALRRARGLPRHPVQIVVSESGQLPFDECVLFTEPTLRVVIVTARRSVAALEERLRDRPWIRVLDAGQPLSLRKALTVLRGEGLAVISALGGHRVASTLVAEGLVTDLYLTASDDDGIRPSLDIHDGPPVLHRRVLVKRAQQGGRTVRFEHLVAPTPRTWLVQSAFRR